MSSTIHATSRRALLAIALSLLVLAQQGAVLHALSHSTLLHADARVSTGHGGTDDACGLCLAFGTLVSGAPTLAFDVAVPPAEHGAVRGAPAPGSAAAPTSGYHSRAPPLSA